MSWNQQRTINNLEYLLNQRTQYMDADNNGTIFEKNITANKFIKTGGGSSLEYLMSDGSTSSGSNIGTGVKNPMITNLNANNYSLTNVGTINDIDIGIVNSDLNIVKDKTQFINSSVSFNILDDFKSNGDLIIINSPFTTDGTVFDRNVYADKFIINGGGPSPPGYLLSDGSISSNSGDDARITALETKTQNISSTSSKLSVSKSFELKLDTSDFFAIRSIDSMLNYLVFNPTITMLYTELNMNSRNINNVGSITISGHELDNFFLKSDGTIDENDYITASDTVITALQTKTQNIATTPTTNIITKSSQFKLSNSQLFSITDDSGPFVSVRKFSVINTRVDVEVPLSMNSYQISGIPTPTNDDQCPNKLYVDTRISNLSGTYATLSQLNTVDANANSKLSKSGGVVNGNITMQTGSISLQTGNLGLGGGMITNVGTLAINDSIYIASGDNQDFMKADGSTDTNRYLNTNGGTLSGPLTIQGSLTMGSNTISCGSLALGGTATSIMRGNGSTVSGTASQYVMGNGTVLTATYPSMTSGTFTVQWTGGAGGTTSDQTINWRRISDGISTTVWLRLTPFTITIGTANSPFGVLCTTATVPANLSVSGQPNLPMISTFNGVIQCGFLVHYGTSLGIQPGNRGAAVAGTVCGIPNITMVSYMI